MIGTTNVKLFENNSLQNGTHFLSFNESFNHKYQAYYRQIELNRVSHTGFPDTQIIKVLESLHPNDAESFFQQSSNPFLVPKLSDHSLFARLKIISPDDNPSILIAHRKLQLIGLPLHLNPSLHLLQSISGESGIGKGQRLNETEFWDEIKSLPLLSQLSENQKKMLRDNYESCLRDDHLLSPLFRAIDWESDLGRNVADLLKHRKPIDVDIAIEFFTPRFEFREVREFAVKSLKSADYNKILTYLPQLIQAVKSHYTEGLESILIQFSKNDIYFCSQLYWLAQIEPSSANAENYGSKRIEEMFSMLFMKNREVFTTC